MDNYTVTGINLKGIAFGETDRLLTILSPDHGLIRAIAPFSRTVKSQLRGRTELFMVNELFLTKGRNLDKISQAETLLYYTGLTKDLETLTASQYLAELVIAMAISGQSQTDLYELLLEHLKRIEKAHKKQVFPHLAQAIFHFLAINGIAPQVHRCCLSNTIIHPNYQTLNWQVGFTIQGTGIISLATFQQRKPHNITIYQRLNAVELNLLQHLGERSIPPSLLDHQYLMAWIKIEKIIRYYTHSQMNQTFSSSSFLDTLATH